VKKVKADSTVLSHVIADSLRREILDGIIRPGERIRQEDVAFKFDASRLPVREALRILESDGLVTLVANTGAWVAKLDRDECIELYEIREKLEPLLIRDSTPSIAPETLIRLEELALRIETLEDTNEFLRLDREFHLLSYSGSQLMTLRSMVERLWNTTQHYRRAFTHLAWGESRWIVLDEHRLLLDALKRKDSDDAERILEMHIRRTRKRLSDHPEIF
jgi:DNA-binding GntR family transcriptional regulator